MNFIFHGHTGQWHGSRAHGVSRDDDDGVKKRGDPSYAGLVNVRGSHQLNVIGLDIHVS